MFSFVGDMVLDPFLGTGTTTVAAAKWVRNSIGYEIDEHFYELALKRLAKHVALRIPDSQPVEDGLDRGARTITAERSFDLTAFQLTREQGIPVFRREIEPGRGRQDAP
jgi:hypothetical protein